MRKQRINCSIVILSIIGFLFSCSNSDQQGTFEDITVVTGLRLIDVNGQDLGVWRAPNENPGSVSIFPNPIQDQVFLFSSSQPISDIWLIPAECIIDSINQNIPTLSTQLTYEGGDIENMSIQTLTELEATSLVLDLSEYSKGMYRLFYSIGDGQFYLSLIHI